MKKTYICPNLLVVRLNTTHSILTVSGGASGSLGISEETISDQGAVWTKESTNIFDEEW
jgi:hypothetical protein